MKTDKLSIVIYIVCISLIIWGGNSILKNEEWYGLSQGAILIGIGCLVALVTYFGNKHGV